MRLQALLEKFAGRREDAIGIDIGSGSIKMAEVILRSGRPFLKKMAIFDAPPSAIKDGAILDEEILIEALQRMTSRNGFAGRQVAQPSRFIPQVRSHRQRAAGRHALDRIEQRESVPFQERADFVVACVFFDVDQQ